MSKSKEVNARQLLQHNLKTSDIISRSSAQYLDRINGAPRPKVEVRGFYLTLDGSLVSVVRPRVACKCPICTGHATPVQLVNGANGIMLVPVNPPPIYPDPESANSEQHDSPQFIVSVLFGGHGNKRFRGEEPGDTYTVDEEGLVIAPDTDEEGQGIIVESILGMVGLCLATRLTVTFQKQAAAAEALAG